MSHLKRTAVTLPPEDIALARELDINISAAARDGLRRAIARERTRREAFKCVICGQSVYTHDYDECERKRVEWKPLGLLNVPGMKVARAVDGWGME